MKFRSLYLPMLLTILAAPFFTFSQTKQNKDSLQLYNAYYLAKTICNNSQKVDRNSALKILGGIYWYAGEDSVKWEKESNNIFQRYARLNAKVNTFKGAAVDLSDAYAIQLKDLENIKNLKKKGTDSTALDSIYCIRKLLDIIKKEKIFSTFDTAVYKKSVELVKTFIDSADIIIQDSANNDSNKIKHLASELEKLTQYKSEFYKMTNEVILKIESTAIDYQNYVLRIDSFYSKLSNDTKSRIADSARPFRTPNNIKIQNPSSVFGTAVQQYAESYQTIVTQPVSPASSLNLQLPSQTAMINALAIYLTNRVKQEAVLWFFDMLRKDAGKYELVRTSFPECTRLLQSTQVFETPNLGSSWQYSLAKDFATLPENVLKSDWLKKRIPNEQRFLLNYFDVGIRTARLMQEKFSYVDIIKRLYLDEQTCSDSSTKNSSIHNMLTVLYAVTNELYTIDTIDNRSNFRLLSFEELRAMTAEEMEVMMSLIDLKYDGVISAMFSKKFAYTRKNADSIAYWAGKLTLTIGQFDKINTEVNLIREKKNNNADYQFSYYNVWKLLTEVLRNIPPANFSPTDKSEVAFAIRCLGDLNEAYELISNKNYIGCMSKVINIIDTLAFQNKVVVNFSPQIPKERKQQKIQSKTDYIKSLIALKSIDSLSNSTIDSLLKKGQKVFAKKKEKGKGITVYSKIDSSNYGQVSFKHYQRYLNDEIQEVAIGSKVDSLSFNRNTSAAIFFTTDDRKATQMLQKMASFLNDVSLAKDEKQLARVVNSYALPPASYKRKRNVWSSIDLNAFVGPYCGYEIIPGKTQYIKTAEDKTDSNKDHGFVYGISAPIGLTYSKTWGRKIIAGGILSEEEMKSPDAVKLKRRAAWRRSNWTTSVTLSIIDLGAVVSYRLDKEITGDTSFAPHDFKWVQLLSPGVHINIGIPKTPLVFSVGTQFTPQLRKVEDNGVELSSRQLNAFRFYGGIYFDIPMFNIWTRERVVKRKV